MVLRPKRALPTTVLPLMPSLRDNPADRIVDFAGSAAPAAAQANGVDHIALDDAIFAQPDW